MLNSGAFSIDRPASGELRIREGGGCLAIFGLPFLAAGLFVLGIVARVVPVSNAETLPAWGWPVLVLMGVAFVAAGGALAFGRAWSTFDLARHTVVRQTGILVALGTTWQRTLTEFDAVCLQFEAGDSDTADSYPVLLRGRGGAVDLRVLSSTSYEGSRKAAADIAAFLNLPLSDRTTAHETIVEASQADAPLHARLRARSHELMPEFQRPAQARCDVEDTGSSVRILVPPVGLRRARVLLSLVPVVLAGAAMLYLRAFFEATHTPPWVQAGFLGFLGLFFGLLPLLLSLRSHLELLRGHTIVTASRAGLTIARRGAWRTRTVEIPADEILDLDYDSREGAIEAVVWSSAQRLGDAGRTVSPETRARALRWATALASQPVSKGIVVKTRGSLVSFAAGLSDAETRYLHAVLTRRLAGLA